jgi:hypothetical protein
MNSIIDPYMIAKYIADFCNTTYFDIMNREAIEIGGLYQLLSHKQKIDKLK